MRNVDLVAPTEHIDWRDLQWSVVGTEVVAAAPDAAAADAAWQLAVPVGLVQTPAAEKQEAECHTEQPPQNQPAGAGGFPLPPPPATV